MSVIAQAQTTIPKNAVIYLPLLKQQIQLIWPALTQPQDMAAQIEEETCVSVTWPSCWNPHTELKTSREYGFGLGQLTITASFNNFTALQKGSDPVLKTWQWTDRYNPSMQIRAQLDMDLVDYKYFQTIGLTETDRLAFMYSAYNGGVGGLISDIKYCTALAQCNHRIWFDNVEKNSVKSTFSLGSVYGGRSPLSINRTYVHDILDVKSPKYMVIYNSIIIPSTSSTIIENK